MSRATSLVERRNELTRTLITESAVAVLENGAVSELTIRAVAKRANMSERTIFRYFPSRDAFLDGVADEVRARLNLPPAPTSLEELDAAPRNLYRAFEAQANLTKAALHSEIFPRMRETQAKVRWAAVRKLVDATFPTSSERARRIAAANIRYYLAASTWHYYRFYFGFSLKDSIACAQTAIRQSVESLAAPHASDAGLSRAAGK